MVGCLTVGAGILARSEGVSKGTGADRRFVKNALKNAELQRNIIKISSQILSVPSKSQQLHFKLQSLYVTIFQNVIYRKGEQIWHGTETTINRWKQHLKPCILRPSRHDKQSGASHECGAWFFEYYV